METDAREILDLLGIEYDDNGQRLTFVCPLPDHADSKPSTSAWPDDGRFHCFGCEVSGDMVDLYAGARALTRDQAEREVARLTGKAPPRSSAPDPAVARRARAALEPLLSGIRDAVDPSVFFVLGEKIDKLCWAWYRGMVDADQMQGGVDRIKKEIAEWATT